jgi:hypothetical protein
MGRVRRLSLYSMLAALVPCRGGGSSSSNQPPAPEGVSVSPATATLVIGATQQFSANTPVMWQVNAITGGDATTGTISP